jgi:photosystem II stability/assembly factor-like uncharacterized protein
MVSDRRERSSGVWLLASLLIAGLLVPGFTVGAGDSSPMVWHWQPYDQGLPTYGMVLTVAVQPTDAAVVYAGTYEPPGLWRSDDRGRSWSKDDGGLEGSPVYAVRWDAIRRRWWVCARDGLYSRSDANLPWQPATFGGHPVYAVAEDVAGRLFAATEAGLFRSSDGTNWQAVPIAALTGPFAILDVAISRDGSTLLAGTSDQGLWLSRDSGQTWLSGKSAMAAGEELGEACVSAVLLDSGTGGVAYAGTSEGAYRSSDGGAIWERMPGLEGRVHAFASGPDGKVYAALAGRVARSADSGRSWEVSGDGLRPDDKVLDLAVSSADPTLIYAASWDGVYGSIDGGQHWQPTAGNVGYPDVNVLAWDSPGHLLAGARHGIYRSAEEQAAWTLLPAASGRTVLTFTDVGNGRDFYAGLSGGLLRSNDGGLTWSEVSSELSDQGIAGVAAGPADPDHLLAWVAFGRVHESQDGGRTWVARWEGLGTVRPVTAIHRTQEGSLYVGAEDGLFRWALAQRAWQALSLPLVAPTVFAIDSDQRDPQVVYAGATDGLWRSPDGGMTWKRWGDGLEGTTVTALAVSSADTEVAFAGTRHMGLYVTADGGANWQPAWDGELAAASVRDIVFSDDGATVYVASDQGVWRGETSGPR